MKDTFTTARIKFWRRLAIARARRALAILLCLAAPAMMAQPLPELVAQPSAQPSVLQPLALTRFHSVAPSLERPPHALSAARLVLGRNGRQGWCVARGFAAPAPACWRRPRAAKARPAPLAGVRSSRISRAPPPLQFLS